MSSELNSKGYIEVKQFLSDDDFNSLKKAADFLEEHPEISGGPMKYFEKVFVSGKEELNRVEKFLEEVPTLNNIIENRLKPMLHRITGNIYYLLKEKINFKMPLAGGFLPHQDAPAFKKLIKNPMLIVMIPLQSTNKKNGYLQVSDNFFEQKLTEHHNGCIDIKHLKDIKWKGIEQVNKDILIFNSYLIHKSDINNSPKSRRCFFLTFNLVDDGNLRDTYFRLKRKKFPPRVERKNLKQFESWQNNLARTIY